MNWKDRIDRRAVMHAVGLTSEKMPADFQGVFKNVTIYHHEYGKPFTKPQHVGVTLHVKPLVRRYRDNRSIKSSKHRTFIVCPKCHHDIPTGRFHQHVDTGLCKRDAAKLNEAYEQIAHLLP
jgi:hypothetical protein